MADQQASQPPPQPQTQPPTQPSTPGDPAARMRTPLLALITAESLERDYQMVALRKAASGSGGGSGKIVGKAGVIAVALAFGGLVTLAAVETSANADVDSASRATLIERIEARREAVQRLQGTISDLREANAEAESGLLDLGDAVNAAENRATAIGATSGFTPVVGEGIRIELDNPEYADPATEHIRDSDLALLANALWSAGAEAIAINGQRLSSRTAIRNSGTAIEVNSTGIAPPYVVAAIGNEDTLASRLLETSSGAAFAVLAGQYGWHYETDNVSEMRLPAAPGRLLQLRSAELATESGRQPEGEE